MNVGPENKNKETSTRIKYPHHAVTNKNHTEQNKDKRELWHDIKIKKGH